MRVKRGSTKSFERLKLPETLDFLDRRVVHVVFDFDSLMIDDVSEYELSPETAACSLNADTDESA